MLKTNQITMTCLTNDSKKQSKIGRYQQIHDLNTKKDVSVHFDGRGGEKCANGLRGGGEGP